MSGSLGHGPRFAGPVTPTTTKPGRRLVESLALEKLSRMQRNTLRSWPMAKVWRRPAGFGVSLDAETYLYVSCSGNLTAEEKRDLLVLLATWQAVDPEALTKAPTPQDG